MSWIETTDESAASPEVARIFAALRARSSHGALANFWRAMGLDPRGLEALAAQHEALMANPAPLGATQAELIAVVVSATNGCAYCVAHHGPRLAAACGDEALARAVARDYREANLAARDRVLLDAAVALTCEPAERTRADIERMREYGWDDAQILKATAIAAFYNMVNRLVSALGVELEAGREAWTFGSQR
jgi:uncharacterized peroxidase-related enzyme